ncbi:hypothetical protein HKD37_14G040616 [Glycine soja]
MARKGPVTRAMSKRLQEDWARAAEEGSRVLMNLRASSFLMQSYPPRALDKRLQEDWAKDAREGPRVLMSLRSTKFHALLFLSFHSSPFSSKLLSMASYGVASPLSLSSPFRCHSSSKKQRNPLMKKILGLQAPMELTSFSLKLLIFNR